MKKLSRFCAVAVLTLALTLSALAGDIGFPGSNNPPPPQLSSGTCEIATPDADATGDTQFPGVFTVDPMTDAALSLLNSILYFF